MSVKSEILFVITAIAIGLLIKASLDWLGLDPELASWTGGLFAGMIMSEAG